MHLWGMRSVPGAPDVWVILTRMSESVGRDTLGKCDCGVPADAWGAWAANADWMMLAMAGLVTLSPSSPVA